MLLVKEKHMGFFDALSGKENPADFLVNSAAKAIKVGAKVSANAAKAAAAKAKEAKEARAAREAEEAEAAEAAKAVAYADEGDEEVIAGPKFCPHCGKPLR
jgi:NADH pyrophosphatase NudC (nudix superfamily)